MLENNNNTGSSNGFSDTSHVTWPWRDQLTVTSANSSGCSSGSSLLAARWRMAARSGSDTEGDGQETPLLPRGKDGRVPRGEEGAARAANRLATATITTVQLLALTAVTLKHLSFGVDSGGKKQQYKP